MTEQFVPPVWRLPIVFGRKNGSSQCVHVDPTEVERRIAMQQQLLKVEDAVEALHILGTGMVVYSTSQSFLGRLQNLFNKEEEMYCRDIHKQQKAKGMPRLFNHDPASPQEPPSP